MKHRYYALALTSLLLAGMASAASPAPSLTLSRDEPTLWEKERAYWKYVEKNDLASYRNLWHENFLGWPSVSPVPVHKDHITDWITSQTNKGLTFKAGEFKPAALEVTGDVAAACYWITLTWLDKEGKGTPATIRITHAWLRNGGEWRIISGMSMPEPAPAAD